MKAEVVMIAAGLALTGALIAWEPRDAAPAIPAITPEELGHGEALIGRVRPYVPGQEPTIAAVPAAANASASASANATENASGNEKPTGPKMAQDGTLLLTFEDLASYTYEHPDPRTIKEGAERPKQIPDEILALKGKTVTAEGHMVPVSVKKGKVTLFVLSRYLEGCCFGQPAMMNEWVDVEMAGDGADYFPYGSILCTGVLDVGEQLDEYGYVRSIYRMKCTKVEETKRK